MIKPPLGWSPPSGIGSYYNHFHVRREGNVSHAHESGHIRHTHDEFLSDEEPTIAPCPSAAGKAFQRLSEEVTGTCVGIPCTFQHQNEWPCVIDAAEEIWCGKDGFRNFCSSHAARINAYHQNARQDHGRDAGRRIAFDALLDLVMVSYPTEFIDDCGTAEETREAKEDFDQAARRELLKTIQESIADSAQTEQEGVQELSWAEGRAFFGKQCWQQMGVSAEEFVRKWEAGEFDDHIAHSKVMRVAMLLPLFDCP